MAHRHGQGAGSCEQGNEHSSSIKRGEFLNRLGERWLRTRALLHAVRKICHLLVEEFMEGGGGG